MSLPALALELFGPVAVAARRSRRYRLLDVDLEQGPSFTLEVKGRAVLVELAARDDTRPAYARTARFDVFARPLLRSTEAPGLGSLKPDIILAEYEPCAAPSRRCPTSSGR